MMRTAPESDPMPLLSQVRKLTKFPTYSIDIPFDYVEKWLARQAEGDGIDFDPDFQRGHVWSLDQQSKFIEYIVKGGDTSLTLLWNHPSFQREISPQADLPQVLLLVDGKQRLNAVRQFLADQVPIFGHTFSEWDDIDNYLSFNFRLKFAINDLQTRAEVLQWYLDINDGGVVHSKDEIERVRGLLAEELDPPALGMRP